MTKPSKVSKKGPKKKKEASAARIEFALKGDGKALAKTIWRAGIGAYLLAAEETAKNRAPSESGAREQFANLLELGKKNERKLVEKLDTKKGRIRIEKVIKALQKGANLPSLDRFKDAALAMSATHQEQRNKLEARMRDMREMLGLQSFDARSKTAEKLNSKLDALEEQVAALKANSSPIDKDVRARVERLGQEIAAIAGDGEQLNDPEYVKNLSSTDERGRLSAPQGAADNLTLINGVGPALEKKLMEAGIYHLWQIAQMSEEQISDLETELGFGARATRGNWKSQAAALSTT